jgi:AcrR family transcriptional regulator
MSPEDRRKMIVDAVLPLMIEYGATVTTNQIARAAGIGEGTIFRAFKDKDELFDTCIVEALKPDRALDALATIPMDQPLADRLTEAAEALGAHLQRMGALMAALHGARKDRRHPRGRGGGRDGGESMAAMREAITDLFEPEKDRLRLPAAHLASLFLSLLFSHSRFDRDEEGPDTGEIIDVFLNGAVLNSAVGAA